MPKFNANGNVIAGYSEVSLDGKVLYGPGGKGCPLTNDLVLANIGLPSGAWEVATLTADGVVTEIYAGGANFLAAGNGRWIGSNPGQGMFGTLSNPVAGVLGAGLDGTLAYVPNYGIGYGLVLNAPDGSPDVSVPDAAVQDIQVLGPGQAIWYEGGSTVRVVGIPMPVFAVTPEKVRRAVYQGNVWLCYWSPQTNTVVLHISGQTDGYELTTPGQLAYNRDMVVANGELRVCWSTTQGEAPTDIVTLVIDTTQPRVPLVPVTPVTQPSFHFTHPVRVRPFFASGSGVPDIFTDGVYTEAPDLPQPMPADRLLLGHDSPADWALPAGLRSYDIPLLECYRTTAETLSASVARWHRQLSSLLEQWPHTCGVIPMFYCQGGAPPHELWTVQEVLDGLGALSYLVNLSPRVVELAPFAYQRANGIVAHAELQVAFHNLLSAESAAGSATLPPIPSESWSLMIDPKTIILYKTAKPSNRSGCVNYILHDDTVFSCQRDGSMGNRPPGTDGPWEQAQQTGSLATFNSDGHLYAFGCAPIDKVYP
jgi:hypothetical protein